MMIFNIISQYISLVGITDVYYYGDLFTYDTVTSASVSYQYYHSNRYCGVEEMYFKG